jgi:thioredoxin-like negative regulator of GroEL
MPLEPEDQRSLTAAEGYIEVGMFLDADEELERVSPEVRHLPELLAARVDIYRALGKWELVQTVAERLAEHDSDNVEWSLSLALAIRRAESIEAARAILLAASEKHPGEAIVHHNLARFACDSVNIAEATMPLFRMCTDPPIVE